MSLRAIPSGLADSEKRIIVYAPDDGEDRAQNCALIAREEDNGSYRGVWTYDPGLVARAFAAVG